MKILVTGASGRIGSALAQSLRAAGHWVRGFDVNPASSDLDDVVTGSLLDADALDQALDGIEAVAHLAALMTWHPKDNPRLFEVNVTGTYHLLQAARNHAVSRFVFASSGEVYPELSPQSLPITEDHPTVPNSPYGMTKLLGEQMVRTVGALSGMPWSILRFSHTQAADELFDANSFFSGPRFYVNAKIRQLESLPQSKPVQQTLTLLRVLATESEQHYISLDQDGLPFQMGMCDVRDLCQGVRLALTHPAAVGEIFNIGARKAFRFDQAVRYLARYTGLPVVEVKLSTVAYRYETSVDKAVSLLGYAPEYDIFGMIDDAASRHPRPVSQP
jgi:UDP-glucose 4-epimerase